MRPSDIESLNILTCNVNWATPQRLNCCNLRWDKSWIAQLEPFYHWNRWNYITAIWQWSRVNRTTEFIWTINDFTRKLTNVSDENIHYWCEARWCSGDYRNCWSRDRWFNSCRCIPQINPHMQNRAIGKSRLKTTVSANNHSISGWCVQVSSRVKYNIVH